MENSSRLEKVLLVAVSGRAVAVSRSNFSFQTGFCQKDEEEKLNYSEKFAEKKFAIFCFICLSLLTFVLSNIN